MKNLQVGEECNVNQITVVDGHVQCGEKRRLNFVKGEDKADIEEVAIILEGINTIMNKL